MEPSISTATQADQEALQILQPKVNPDARPLGAMLRDQGVITEEQLARALEEQQATGALLGETLVALGYLPEEALARTLAAQLGLPYFDLGEDYVLDPAEVRLVPEPIVRRFCAIPIKENGSPALTLVMGNPLDIEAVDTIRALTHLDIHKAVSTAESIVAVIDRCYRADAFIEKDLRDIIELEASGREDSSDLAMDADQLRVQANDAPVVRFVNLLLMQAVRDRASDIHFEPGENDVAVRLRVDGRLREMTPPPKRLYPAIVTRIKILSNMDIAERRLPLDGRFKFKLQDRVIDIRVSSLPEVHGEKLVLRVLDQTSLVVDMVDIGFEQSMMARFQRILQFPHGIILLTGPTGSGKTTTLYSALNYLKSAEKNIQTVEDPVEYLIPGINQMPISPNIGLDFARALRSILRQDPDIIMIGEIRDLETAEIAMRASLTGHLVLSTLHTNDATSAFSRLRDIGIEPYLIAATIKLVISQRLVRTICEDCRGPVEADPDELEVVKRTFPDAGDWTYQRGAGCLRCRHTGFLGRKGIFEFLEVSQRIQEMIHASLTDNELRKRAIGLGMEPLLSNGFRKVKKGMTTVDEVLSVCTVDDIG